MYAKLLVHQILDRVDY